MQVHIVLEVINVATFQVRAVNDEESDDEDEPLGAT
jgi:hypothetical protein